MSFSQVLAKTIEQDGNLKLVLAVRHGNVMYGKIVPVSRRSL